MEAAQPEYSFSKTTFIENGWLLDLYFQKAGNKSGVSSNEVGQPSVGISKKVWVEEMRKGGPESGKSNEGWVSRLGGRGGQMQNGSGGREGGA